MLAVVGSLATTRSRKVRKQRRLGIFLINGTIYHRNADNGISGGGEGLVHAKIHENQARAIGYKNIEDMIVDVANNFDEIYLVRPPHHNGHNTFILAIHKTEIVNKDKIVPVYFNLTEDGQGNYYLALTAYPLKKIKKRRTDL
ncbi:MAG: hypothetical protein MJ041_04325 [Acidaminococcaceae bacterium]|nr:hypothetical protein [Acidaminococcaceae bacterium]